MTVETYLPFDQIVFQAFKFQEFNFIRDTRTNKPKNTGTIVFESHADAERVLASPQHFIDGKARRVERLMKQVFLFFMIS